MARFEWERFLRSRHIDFVPAGKNQVAVHCPFCGPDDPSHHMSINLAGAGWRCWRAPASHFGRAPARLVQKLTGCSVEESHRITGGGPPPPPTSTALADNLARLQGRVQVRTRPNRLTLPPSFHPLLQTSPQAGAFLDYLEEERHFRPSEARWLAEAYDLHWATTGPYAWRLIFPVRSRHGVLLTWTGRAIGANTTLRYKQPKVEDVITEAPRTLLGLDKLWAAPDPRVLVVCEGPLDAARVSVAGAALGVHATCLFGLNMSSEQATLLAGLSERFDTIALLLDAGAEAARLRALRQLTPTRVVVPILPPGVKDPGDLTTAQATEICLGLLAQQKYYFTSGGGALN